MRTDRELGEMLGLHGAAGDEMVFEAGRLFQSMDSDGDRLIDVEEFTHYFNSNNQSTISDSDVEAKRPQADDATEELVPGDARP